LVEQEPAQPDGARLSYRLTEKGRDTIGILLMQDQWERDYGESERALNLVMRKSGYPLQATLLNRPGGQVIEARRLDYVFDGAVGEPPEVGSNARRRGDNAQPSTEFGAISVLGDPWAWRILIATILGVRRFDEFSQVLGIASNVLTDRLGRLVEADILLRERYSRQPPRYEYRLAVAGRALHPLFCAMYGWGERWLYPDEALPMRLFDRITGARVMPVVCDATTLQPIDATALQPGQASIAA
jgi:DNA-binding HxlR family transcriptional regulator